MTTRIKLRRDTAANWNTNNPILALGEPGLETDTRQLKHGDGVTHWMDLAHSGYAPREQVGYAGFHGLVPNVSNSGQDWWFEGVETDPSGNAYYTGGWVEYNNYTGTTHVVKIDLNGDVQWQKEIIWADGYEGNAVSSVYNSANNQLVVVAEMYKSNVDYDGSAAVIKLNASTGAIVGLPTMIRDEVVSDGSRLGDIAPADIVLGINGDPVVVGYRSGAGVPYALTTASIGQSGIIYVDTAVFAGKLPRRYNDWYITGTNITSEVYITEVNYYPNQQPTALVTSGTNATFTMASWRVDTNGQLQFPNSPGTFGLESNQQGSGYAINDTLYLNPNQYGGLTSATITVTQVGGGGQIQNFTFTGTFNTSTLKLQVSNSIDFTTTGSWTALNYSFESFVWTPSWTRTFGGSNSDAVNAAATDSQGNIYLACLTYDDTTPAPWGYGYTRGFLAKLDSNGNKVWFKQYGAVDHFYDDDGVTGVAVDSNDDIVIVEDNLVTKLDSAGAVIWQKDIGYDAPFDMWNTCVDVDSNDNIYIAAEYDSAFNNTTDDDFLIVKFDSAGNVLWWREAGTTTDEDVNWNNGYQILSVTDDHVHLAGSSYQGDDDVGVAISFPTDGSGTGTNHIGSFFIHETPDWGANVTTSTVVTVGGLQFTSTQVTVTNETNITAFESATPNIFRKIRTGELDGRLEDVYSISFEDGSVQTSAYAGLVRAQDGDFVYNTNDFYPNLEHANKMMRWYAPEWGSSSIGIYIPHNDDVAFPIGTQLHFVKDQSIRSFMFWPWGDIGNSDDVTIIPSSPDDNKYGSMYNSGEGWSVRHPNNDEVPARATLTKIDTNRWLLECASPVHIMDWSW